MVIMAVPQNLSLIMTSPVLQLPGPVCLRPSVPNTPAQEMSTRIPLAAGHRNILFHPRSPTTRGLETGLYSRHAAIPVASRDAGNKRTTNFRVA